LGNVRQKETEVSWYQEKPETSLQFLKEIKFKNCQNFRNWWWR
jgi:hypothetical protein